MTAEFATKFFFLSQFSVMLQSSHGTGLKFSGGKMQIIIIIIKTMLDFFKRKPEKCAFLKGKYEEAQLW